VRGEREKVWEQKDFGIPREFRDNDKNDNERSAAEDANGIPRCAVVPALMMHLSIERVGSHGRWKRPCLQTAHMTL
jgi:hypothetical protein